jgi:hypothetical protein
MNQAAPKFEDRVRFNWAFHDGTRDAQDGRVRNVEDHFDPIYAKGYVSGVASFGLLQVRAETSNEAWAQHEAREMAEQQLAATRNDYQTAKAIQAGTIKRLYLAGHNVKRGQAVALEYTDAPPVRFYQCSPRRVRAIVDRFNRRFGTIRPV